MSSVRYQGYPYVNPTVIDAPSLDAVTAAKWTNLPRKPMSTAVAGASGSGAGSGAGSSGNPVTATPVVPLPERGPVDPPSAERGPVAIPPKKDIDENPVVYIELPQADGSDVCQSIESEDVEPEYVQNTILYDPFEDRRIVPKEDGCSQSSASDTNSVSNQPGSSSHYRPHRPNTLDLMSPGSSSTQSPHTSSTPGLPYLMEKESLVYGAQNPSDRFPLSPIDMSEFPEPPPAYTEVAMTPVQPPRPQTPVQSPPRTEVIVPPPSAASPVGVMNFDRKYLTCHHCGARVHTLVIRENGHMTYCISFLLFLFIMPFFIIVYFTDCFKHKNHYCPNCNRLIGYVLPLCGKKVHYVP